MENTQSDKVIVDDHHSQKVIIMKTTHESSHHGLVESSKNNGELCGSSSMDDIGKLMISDAVDEQEAAECGRGKLKRHWTEMAGRVFIPEIWNHEGFLMDWIDYSSFDALLAPEGVDSARKALVAERRQLSSRGQGKVIDVKSFR